MQINIVLLTIAATSAAVPGSTLQTDSIIDDKPQCAILSLYPESDGQNNCEAELMVELIISQAAKMVAYSPENK